LHNNPYLQQVDPFQDQKAKQDKVNKETIEFQRLCFEVFHANNDGKALWEHIKERYLLRALFAPTHLKASELALYYEGFKEALRGLWAQGDIHLRRINGELG
jgi:hypothetical protein